uniref:Uncharacterized protein n=2 Tax=Sphaerodactylus townsendi TaxID=933632 RepID=A0ACB8GDY5_9SAUR
MQTDSATQGNLFQVVMVTPQRENGNLSCEELSAHQSTVLHLDNRNLASFPSCLPGILEHLDLSKNLLPEFSGQDAAHLPGLQVLSLRQNKIQQVSWGAAGSLTRLQTLDLSFNLLSSVPACNASTLGNLRQLSLAGNPITEIQTFAFSCYPQLQFLDLSSTLLGQDGNDGIQESAFAVNFLHGDASETVGSALITLHLSATFLERINPEWLKDLPRLTTLHLSRMSRLKSLDAAVFVQTPRLQKLYCHDSHVLSQVETESFSQISELAFLTFQNCNLSSLKPWDLSSLDNLVIDLYGNPLECRCELSWLFSEPQKIVLQRASETICYAHPEDNVTLGSIPLSRLYDECQSNRTTDPTPQLKTGNLYSTYSSFTTKTSPDSASFPQEWHHSSIDPHSVSRGDLTVQESTQADMLAYKEETANGSTESPSTMVALTTTSTMLAKTSVEQTLGDTTDLRSHDPTKADSLVHPVGTLYNSTLSPPTAAPTETGSSPTPSALFIPLKSSTPTELPMQNSTKLPTLSNPASTDVPLHYVDHNDYEDHQEESEAQTIGPCAYDPCRHLQTPCSELQQLSFCLCPGISDDFTIPEPPRLREVSKIRDTSAEIHWCAPNSYVRFYQLIYRLKGSLNKKIVSEDIFHTTRQYTLNSLRPGSSYQACVIAFNKAGSSQSTGWSQRNVSCVAFTTRSNVKSSFAVLSVVSGLLLIGILCTSGCFCKRLKTPHPEQLNTHLVSYKNPAFEDSSK